MTIADPGRWGVSHGYWDVSGNWRDAPVETVEAILAQMGAEGDDEPPHGGVITVRLDRPPAELPPGRIILEDGGEVGAGAGSAAVADLPPGYHTLEHPDGSTVSLIASPGGCPLPRSRQWGFATQLYGVRSENSWGMGDLADLRSLAEWSAGLGAGLVVVNPLHATAPTPVQEASPYSPGSRCFLNPIYLAVEQVPGASESREVARLAAIGRALNEEPLIDRDRVWALKSDALRSIFASSPASRSSDRAFEAFRSERGAPLESFAIYSALSELHGSDWKEWPAGLRHPDGPAVRAFAGSDEGSLRVGFHAWLQWLAERQLEEAGRFGPGSVGVVQDLAVGINRDGADGWMWQDVFALGMDFGAPPDEFNTRGQNWALPPFDPWRLRSSGYRPLIESLRGVLRHAGGVRVDHVMGLFRLFWIPAGCEPSQGAYVRYPSAEMLDILALEAQRAGAVVVGEDLGTVEDEVRHELYERRVLSYRVWWFEQQRTPAWPERALGAITTHDLPTVAGVLDGSDLEAQRACGMNPSDDAVEGLRRRLLDWTGSDAGDDAGLVIERAYADLARAPCLLLVASLEDSLAVRERPNMPGTTDEWPNWRQRLPVPIEVIEQEQLPRSVASRLDSCVHVEPGSEAGEP